MTFSYLLLNLVFSLVIVLASWRKLSQLAWGAVGFALAVVGLLTLVFDNLIVGLNIVDYDPRKILGIAIPIAPIEDLAYTITGAILVPVLWQLFGCLGKNTNDGGSR